MLSVRLNADTAETWQRLMVGVTAAAAAVPVGGSVGFDITAPPTEEEPFAFSFGSDAQPAFDNDPLDDDVSWDTVTRNMQALFEGRQNLVRQRGGVLGMPWIVPHLIKTADTLRDMETFFDRWMHLSWHAVIAPAQTGCGLMPELSPVRMAPPMRRACRQLSRRMTIHSDGRVAQCDQDWLGRATAGDAATQPLAEIWQSMHAVREQHANGKWDNNSLCAQCDEWHRP